MSMCSRPTKPAETCAGWGMIGAGTALIAACYGLARFAYGLFAPEFQATFQISQTVSGVIAAGSYIGYCIAIVVSLVLTEHFGARRLAVTAGMMATVGTGLVAIAPSTPILASGVVIAGSSTGIASPPLAVAVSRWIREPIRDRAQTVVNAGTGIGVLVSGPIALVVVDEWRWAWAVFAVLTAATTMWVHLTIPFTNSERGARSGEREYVAGTTVMILGAFLMGLSSAAIWTFGRDLVTNNGGASATASILMWTVLGAAGVVGALSGDLVERIGLVQSWTVVMVVMASATGVLAVAPSSTVVIFVVAAVFGASYIILTGLVLVWSTRIYPSQVSFGVGLSFLMIAVGQAVGAPLAGTLSEAFGASTGFFTCAALGLVGAIVHPRSVGAGSDLRLHGDG